MPFVTRDGSGNVAGVVLFDPSGTLEELDASHADIAAFELAQAQAPSDADQAGNALTVDPAWKGWVARQAGKEGITVAQLETEIKAQL